MTLPATIMTSSVPTTVGGHMMYPSPHAVMYAPTSGLADGGLAVLNAFSQAPSAMQVSHSQVQDQGKAAPRVPATFSCCVFLLLVPEGSFRSSRGACRKPCWQGCCSVYSFFWSISVLCTGFLEFLGERVAGVGRVGMFSNPNDFIGDRGS